MSWKFIQTRTALVVPIIAGAAFSIFVLYSMIFLNRASDFSAHLAISEELGFEGWFSYSMIYPLIHIGAVWIGSPASSQWTLLFLLLVCLSVRWLLTSLVFKSAFMTPVTNQVLSLSLLVFMPLVDPRKIFEAESIRDISIFFDIYLGQITPNVWHNSTTIFAGPFALLATLSIMRFFDTISWKRALLASFLVSLATLTKPNWTFAAIPALFVYALQMFRHSFAFNRRVFAGVVALSAPALTISLFQLFDSFLRPESVVAGSIRIDPLTQWRAFSDNLSLSLVRSIVLSVLLTLLVFLQRRKLSNALRFSWLVFGFSLLAFSALVETYPDGTPRLHGNFSWGLIPALYVLLVFALKDWFEVRRTMEKSRIRIVCDMSVFGILLLHSLTGLAYGILIAIGRMCYA